MATTLEKVTELLDYQKQRYPDIVMPSDDINQLYIDDIAGENPWRVLYHLILEDSVLAARDAASYTDDGVSIKSGTGLDALAALLPMYKKLADDFDLNNSDEVVYVETPSDSVGDKMLELGA